MVGSRPWRAGCGGRAGPPGSARSPPRSLGDGGCCVGCVGRSLRSSRGLWCGPGRGTLTRPGGWWVLGPRGCPLRVGGEAFVWAEGCPCPPAPAPGVRRQRAGPGESPAEAGRCGVVCFGGRGGLRLFSLVVQAGAPLGKRGEVCRFLH